MYQGPCREAKALLEAGGTLRRVVCVVWHVLLEVHGTY